MFIHYEPFLGRVFEQLVAEEIFDVGPAEPKHRPELDGANPRTATCGVVAHPTLRDAQAIGYFLGAQQSFAGLQGYDSRVWTPAF